MQEKEYTIFTLFYILKHIFKLDGKIIVYYY
jgi:hypothetical protein